MKNIEMSVKEGKLIISVDLAKEYGESKSGKSTVVGTTEGNISLPEPYSDVKIGLNIYRMNKKPEGCNG